MISYQATRAFRDRPLDDYEWIKKVPKEELIQALNELPGDFTFHVEPYQHQYACIYLGVKLRQFFFDMSMGTGKSCISLILLRYFYLLENLNRMLVLCPRDANVLEWEAQAKQFIPDVPVYPVLGSTKEKTEIITRSDRGLYLVSYFTLKTVVCTMVKSTNKKRKSQEKVDLKKVQQVSKGFQAVVFDEVHKLKNIQSNMFKACKAVSKGIDIRYSLTGTSLGRDPEDLWAQYWLTDYGRTLGDTKGLFKSVFFKTVSDFYSPTGEKQVFDPKQSELLGRMLKHGSIKYIEEECNDLPDKTVTYIKIPQSKEIKSHNARILKEIRETFSKGEELERSEVKNFFSQRLQLTAGFLNVKIEDEDDKEEKVAMELTSQPKLDELEELIKEIPLDCNILIFHNFRHSAKLISERLKKMKIKHLCANGDTKNKNSVEKWKKDPKMRVLVANDEVAGTGGNLQKANYQIYYDIPISLRTHQQTLKRSHRSGQTKACFIYYLVMEGTVDEDVLEFHKEGKELDMKINFKENDD